MDKKLLEKVIELKKSGLTVGEIADELNVSMETARYLVLNAEKLLEKEEIKKNVDIFIDWKNIGSSAYRLRKISSIISDIIKSRKIEFDTVVGISNSGVPIATLVAEELDKELAIYIPKKQLLEDGKRIIGSISQNFSTISYKRAVIIDDVVTSGSTLTECVKQLKNSCSPKLIVVLIDKSGLDEIDGVPLVPLIRVGAVNIEGL
ncbi:orotate phosphoribosyltransferase-like protein [Methanocaldococcus villosus KIN24-T80]|uniref:Transcriptional regulator GfcR n=1 Tax=Methanocaldococcus villosus KIN24-T80 TaxID=1069083 RepID=N6VS87_9EURY|nr:orotate phosphoribosyltransferase-like protein [Methanocaldococcus villosus]ENN96016.1 orotate phosphoribosyltransferase-like protein [Methanocaldococcus villosus KIN24-T80]